MITLLWEAMREYGVKEYIGEKNNKRIVQYAIECGFPFRDDETSWCGIFMSAMAKRASLPFPDAGYSARSWLDWGDEVKSPVTGDIVVYWRVAPNSWQGHVGIFISYADDGESIYTLGGNQGNMVQISKYSAEKVLGFRRL